MKARPFMKRACVVFTALLVGCGSASDSAGPPETCNGRGDRLEALALEGEAGLELTFVSAAPMAPVVGDNSWVVALSDDTSEPIVGASDDIFVTPFMPAHMHGSPVAVGVYEQQQGTYELSPVNTHMPGYWEVTIELSTGEFEDAVVVGVCVQ